MAFNIADAFADLTPKGPIRTMITEIELHLIDNNPKNYYSMDGIAELAENIRMFGLMEPLIVKPTADGRYMLISGHRRRAALRMLAEEGYYPDGMHHKIDCILHEGPVNLPGLESLERMEAGVKLWEELKLLAANADTRVMSSADKAMEVRRIREIFKALAQLGYKAPGRTRDQIAETAKISASRVARLDVIDKGLKDQRLRNAWLKGDLKETSAYEVARFSPEVQKHMTDSQVGFVCRNPTERVKAFMSAVEADLRQVKHLPPEKESTADTKAEPPKIDASGHIEWDASAYLEQRQKEDDEFFEMLFDIRDQYFRELGALNDRREGIEKLKQTFKNNGGATVSGQWYDGSPKGLRLRKRKEKLDITRTWTDVYDMLCTIALNDEALKAEDPEPKESTADTAAAWKTGKPQEVGDYVVVYGLSKTEDPKTSGEKIMQWDGIDFVNKKSRVAQLEGMNVYRWVKLPEV